MAEFGELLPGTEWLTANGKRAVVNVRIVSAGMFEPDGREMSNASWSFTERDVAGWVPWIEPIAVGDTVTIPAWMDPCDEETPFDVLAADDEWLMVRRSDDTPEVKPAVVHGTLCRKVNDE